MIKFKLPEIKTEIKLTGMDFYFDGEKMTTGQWLLCLNKFLVTGELEDLIKKNMEFTYNLEQKKILFGPIKKYVQRGMNDLASKCQSLIDGKDIIEVEPTEFLQKDGYSTKTNPMYSRIMEITATGKYVLLQETFYQMFCAMQLYVPKKPFHLYGGEPKPVFIFHNEGDLRGVICPVRFGDDDDETRFEKEFFKSKKGVKRGNKNSD